jgi:hypothetical protein
MLDVGGNHGLYTSKVCEKHPGLQGTIVDWPIGLEAAQQTLDERPEMADRIELVECDFEAEELPEGYDFAFLGQIVHGLTAEGNQALFEKLSRATTERGTVTILDQVADPPSTSRFPFDPMNSAFSEGIAALWALDCSSLPAVDRIHTTTSKPGSLRPGSRTCRIKPSGSRRVCRS